MSDFNQLQNRLDKLAFVYMEHTCDISSMSVEEYIKKFNEISEEISEVYSSEREKKNRVR